jgi:hypothetical protein
MLTAGVQPERTRARANARIAEVILKVPPN